MSEQVLNDILEIEEWSNFVGSFIGFSGNADLIAAFDYSSIAQLTVGEYLSLIDAAETAILNTDLNAIKQQVQAILNNPLVAGELSEADKQEILSALDLVTESNLTEGFAFLRDELAGFAPSTLLVDALNQSGPQQPPEEPSGPTNGNDVITGTTASDDVDLLGGNDAFWAGPGDVGDDTVDGGTGNDTIGGAVGNDSLNGDAGSDVLFGGPGEDDLSGGGDNDVIWAGTGEDDIDGDEGDDTLGGGAGSDDIDGGDGNDVIYGGADGAADTVDGGDGDDEIFGGGGNDSLDGGDDNDVIYNGAGNDTVNGGDGADTLWGGGGDDVLTGGDGPDEFAFVSGNGNDTVTDLDFDEGDIVYLGELGFSDAASVLSAMSDVGGNVELTVSGDMVITFENISVADFSANQDALIL